MNKKIKLTLGITGALATIATTSVALASCFSEKQKEPEKPAYVAPESKNINDELTTELQDYKINFLNGEHKGKSTTDTREIAIIDYDENSPTYGSTYLIWQNRHNPDDIFASFLGWHALTLSLNREQYEGKCKLFAEAESNWNGKIPSRIDLNIAKTAPLGKSDLYTCNKFEIVKNDNSITLTNLLVKGYGLLPDYDRTRFYDIYKEIKLSDSNLDNTYIFNSQIEYISCKSSLSKDFNKLDITVGNWEIPNMTIIFPRNLKYLDGFICVAHHGKKDDFKVNLDFSGCNKLTEFSVLNSKYQKDPEFDWRTGQMIVYNKDTFSTVKTLNIILNPSIKRLFTHIYAYPDKNKPDPHGIDRPNIDINFDNIDFIGHRVFYFNREEDSLLYPFINQTKFRLNDDCHYYEDNFWWLSLKPNVIGGIMIKIDQDATPNDIWALRQREY